MRSGLVSPLVNKILDRVVASVKDARSPPFLTDGEFGNDAVDAPIISCRESADGFRRGSLSYPGVDVYSMARKARTPRAIPGTV